VAEVRVAAKVNSGPVVAYEGTLLWLPPTENRIRYPTAAPAGAQATAG